MIEKFVRCSTSSTDRSIRDSIIIALTSLLSTRASPWSNEHSVGLQGFGVPCWQTMSSDSDLLCRNLTQRIVRHEPRLGNLQVSMDESSGELVFLIEGSVAEPVIRHFHYKVTYPCHLRMS